MTLWQKAYDLAERAPVPDWFLRLGIGTLVGRTSRQLAVADPNATESFARELQRLPIAIEADAANSQHYEVPAEFFERVLGPQRKYSCCLYDRPDTTLADAEERALALTAEHASLSDGQTILELGCGWGSLSLWMARTYPRARIVAVSNSRSQRAFIESRARTEGLSNIIVMTADMNTFTTEQRFDRIISVEMFEHIANWRALLRRCRGWLASDGRLFMHVFTHRSTPYRFDLADKSDWIAQHFFTGGCMPSRALIRSFPDLFSVEQEWYWEGTHYARTAEDWLKNLDDNRASVSGVLEQTYAADASIWQRRWRFFFLATSGLFGFDGGREWGVSHYLLRPHSHRLNRAT